LGAGGPRFKSGRPDQNISRIFFELLKARFTQNSSVEFDQTGGLNSQECYSEIIERRRFNRTPSGQYGENSGDCVRFSFTDLVEGKFTSYFFVARTEVQSAPRLIQSG
jgi:hypothetical protein